MSGTHAHATERLVQIVMPRILFQRFKSEIKAEKKRETGPESVRVKESVTYYYQLKDGEVIMVQVDASM